MKPRTATVMVTISRWLTAALLTLAAGMGGGCKGSPAPGPVVDLAVPGDLECAPRACVAEDNEDCQGCFERIGNCCYLDPDWGEGPGTRDQLVERCRKNPGCSACCNECKQMTCESMKKRGVCPYIP